MIKMLSLSLIALGLMLAPAYWIYAKFFTGSQAVLEDLMPGAPQENGAPTWKSAEFTLTADMAPAGLVLLAQGHFSPNMEDSKPPRDLYTATLYRGEAAAKPLGFSLGVSATADSNPAFREHLLLMQQVRSGNYHLEVAAVNPPTIQIDRMQLQVRQNLHEPDPRVVMGGIILLILGILGLVMN
jgi:hypothetical protein